LLHILWRLLLLLLLVGLLLVTIAPSRPTQTHLVCLAVQLHLVALHDLLHCRTNVTQPHINASLLDACGKGQQQQQQQQRGR
jgi:hypothetical protein